MTRINVAVKPAELVDRHLLAEHRELKRIPNKIRKGNYNLEGIPEQFTLGKGHVKFFYDKMFYLHKRYEALYDECVKRGFNVTYFGESFREIPKALWNDYIETDRDRQIILERISERLKTMKNNGKVH